MTEPFLPLPHTQSDEIDAADPGSVGPPSSEDPTRGGVNEVVAADPGPGAPSSLPQPHLTEEEARAQREQFEQRMREERKHPHLFRTPHPE